MPIDIKKKEFETTNKSVSDEKEKAVKLGNMLIVRRYEPIEFKELMRELSPIYSTWLISPDLKIAESI